MALESLLPAAYSRGIRIITNGGGVNPEEAAGQIENIARKNGLSGLRIAVIRGDDILDKLDKCLEKGWRFVNLDTGEEDIGRIRDRIVSAHAYIGSDSIIDALRDGADIVITGRCSDNALYVAPIMHEFGWKFEEPYWNLINSAVTTGHIIECAEWCSGQGTNLWERLPDPESLGYPIAEFYEDGTAVITKVPDTGGLVNEWTVKEQLVYEVHDPANYIMPDGIADMTTLKLEDLGNDRVRISDMSGRMRPDSLKVQIGYSDGYIAEGMSIIPAPKALTKARRADEIGWRKPSAMGIKHEDAEVRIDYIGINSLLGPIVSIPDEDSINEIGRRIAVKGKTPGEAQLIMAMFIDLTPVGTGFSAPSKPRAVTALWPTLIPREDVATDYIIKEVR